ncbi:MAG: hypothetical protein AAF939_15355, partial [Planctomycetota bacterium]
MNPPRAKTVLGDYIFSQHGWPAVHGVSLRCSPNLNNIVKLNFGSSLTDLRPSELESKIFWNIAPYREAIEPRFPRHFWTSIENWPVPLTTVNGQPGSKYLYRIVWPGLLVNLVCLLVVCFLIGYWCENRIRGRGTIFQFSIREFFVSVFVMTGALAILSYQNQKVIKQKTELQNLREYVNGNITELNRVFLRDAFSSIVARLFDYRTVPFYDDQLFLPISRVNLNVPSWADPLEQNASLVELNNFDLPLELRLGTLDLIETLKTNK